MQRTTMVRILLITYSLLLLYFMFAGFNRSVHLDYRYNMVPFHTISKYLANVSARNLLDTLINLVGNVAVFIPFGYLIPAAFPSRWSFSKFLLLFTALIILLETAQMLLRVGTGDVDDLFLNVIGGLLGYEIYRFFTNEGN
ncbi:VanZ family protein [Paenibacillus shunpengii]|uniref:VanZ family protein n=1 Tax=Paenibacillus shunpengii TaxID=2054424 RepID=A0ABW5SJ25_9BACL|nr:VanZ family protein [Paenibacillus sp. PDC88]SDW33247.1 VanZ like family protein [Paenibacillus sp. PDC88]